MKNSIKISRQELYEKVWSFPLTQLCKEYNLSDNGLRKICIKQDIPLPISGIGVKFDLVKKLQKKNYRQKISAKFGVIDHLDSV